MSIRYRSRKTLGELEANMNAQLSRFQWGVVSVEVSDDGLAVTPSGAADEPR
ncbi:cellulose synthase operon protein D [Klebsiella michiganensis]|uniref:Cellulose synthase operon protein D n=1 Tax=Klebsiella michiganensis TaxID=1134687 RepID=A0A7H4PFT3_9ENTR|nr:cellulose synthase operon protein D [Klebsiella michiganensis]